MARQCRLCGVVGEEVGGGGAAGCSLLPGAHGTI